MPSSPAPLLPCARQGASRSARSPRRARMRFRRSRLVLFPGRVTRGQQDDENHGNQRGRTVELHDGSLWAPEFYASSARRTVSKNIVAVRRQTARLEFDMPSSIAQFWDDAIVPTLVDYIKIPAKSPHFDKEWAQHGYIDAAVELPRLVPQARTAGMKLECCACRAAPGSFSGNPFELRFGEKLADVRPPRQAARDDRLARRLRAVDP